MFSTSKMSLNILVSTPIAITCFSASPAWADALPTCVNATAAVESTECGSNSSADLSDSSAALGSETYASDDLATAVGARAIAFAIDAGDFVGLSDAYLSPYSNLGATSLGAYSFAVGEGSVAVGDRAAVGTYLQVAGTAQYDAVTNGTALGSTANVRSYYGTAVGYGASVSANFGIALGGASAAAAHSAIAIGFNTVANSASAIGIGLQSVANGFNAVALGTNSATSAAGAIAIGGDSDDDGNGATATGTGAVALGDSAQASAAGSVAIGAGAIADQINTVSVGAAGSERRIVNVQAGVAPTDAVNVSQLQAVTGGITTDVTALGTTTATHTTQITNLQTGLAQTNSDVANLQDGLADETASRTAADTALGVRVGAVEAVTANLDDRFNRAGERADAGTATAVALSGAMFLPGKSFNLTANVGAYRGAVAAALQFGALVSDNAAVNAGFAKGFSKGGKAAVRAGFTLGW